MSTDGPAENPYESSRPTEDTKGHLTAPDPNERGWPKGIRYIIGNEGCERFSYYGMRSVLQVHLTALFLATNYRQVAAEEHAQEMVHLFMAGVYAFPIIGAVIADRLLGKYRTILYLSLVYCLGHFVLSLAENTLPGMWVGLSLIAIGSGGIKPCVSAHVGDQFGKSNWHLVERVFQAFYFIINFGSFFSTLLIPFIYNWEKKHLNWSIDVFGYEFTTSIAFGLPGVLMFIATIMFWMGRKVFVHVPASPGGKLGLLDAISSSLMFSGLILLPMFFLDLLSPFVFWVTAGATVGLGLALFAYRQKLKRDDGFLAVLLYSLGALVTFKNAKARAEVPADTPRDSIRRNWLFASAAEEFDELTAEGPRAVLRIISVFFLVSVFWSLFDQHASSWIRQASKMDLTIGSQSLMPSQISALNPLMVMALIPLNNFLLFPWIDRNLFRMTPLRKMTIGMFVASLAFVNVALLQRAVDTAGAGQVHVLWQFFPYLIMTQAEVMVSITGLEFAYTQAPRKMKSTIMGFWLLSVAFGNKLVEIITKLQRYDLPDFMDGFVSLFAGSTDGEATQSLERFFWVFAGLMAVAALLFGIRAMFYRYKDYTQ